MAKTMNGEEAVVLFSGGSDSTLAAVMACQRFSRVHLLTYRTSPMSRLEKSRINAKRLQQKFGSEKVTHEFLDSDKIFRMLYHGNYLRDLKKYKTYLSACVCSACSLSWHVSTIIYNIRHNIRHASDGERYEDIPIWAELMESNLKMVRGLYREYGISYETPVYKIRDTDRKLFELGITPERDVKIEHFGLEMGDYSLRRWKSTQPDCHGGIVGAIYLSCFFLPLYGQAANEKTANEYYREKLDVCTQYLQRLVMKRDNFSVV